MSQSDAQTAECVASQVHPTSRTSSRAPRLSGHAGLLRSAAKKHGERAMAILQCKHIAAGIGVPLPEPQASSVVESDDTERKHGRKSARVCGAWCGTVFTLTNIVAELAGATATALALALLLKVHAFPTLRSHHQDVFVLPNCR
ncbi:uncharacterized protein PHACADRAFT_201814 [Phanerochaete carnosa HHB-10118-sp]|uniref:Uncharacterized protein n=1 Tax=Phanerochaete carnosa (strain HHB-10118-sp) TaxID=650164 RepID=K5VRX4_PHACS|nr:uncharacterized protein PHACADRAFT_201814 [Phanerochaete carnosa HHB-10118-sp]EKM49294.1 hypothetical protein PHACADRAFT_201814 [Phanerochaete carnosa HHB-10118-sp]